MNIFLQILLGLFLGYITASFVESLLHRYILHAPSSFIRFWKKNHALFGSLYEEYMIHKIHHFDTFKVDSVTQFLNNEERENLNTKLALSGQKFSEHVKRTQYGLRAQPRALLIISIFLSIVLGIPLLLIFGKWVFTGMVPFMYFLPYFMSRIIHPFSHMPYNKAITEPNSNFIRLLLKTKYMQKVIGYHYVHHQYINCNYNLILGADYILKWNRKTSKNNVESMKKNSN